MDKETVISVERVSKKYCKSLKKSMLYGAMDIGRNMLGLSSRSERLRKDEFWALNDISFEVKKGETLGIIGPNGSGKTTLLKLLNGIFWPDQGKVTIKGRVGALIELGAGFHPLLTGRENIFINAAILGMTKNEIRRKFDSIVEFAGIADFIDSPVKYYSSGMYLRLGFAIAVHSEPNVLLVDEVLAVGDEGFQRQCFNKIGDIKKQGMSTILVSHNMHVISSFAEKVIVLENGRGEYFQRVVDGIREYLRFFSVKEDLVVERICSGNENIRFDHVAMNQRLLSPKDSFSVSMKYVSTKSYGEVDIDVAILREHEFGLYFQATNKAYGKRINLPYGKGELEITVKDIPMNNSTAKIAVAIWSKNRNELLFWWRFPVEFKEVEYSTGKNFLLVTYELRSENEKRLEKNMLL